MNKYLKSERVTLEKKNEKNNDPLVECLVIKIFKKKFYCAKYVCEKRKYRLRIRSWPAGLPLDADGPVRVDPGVQQDRTGRFQDRGQDENEFRCRRVGADFVDHFEHATRSGRPVGVGRRRRVRAAVVVPDVGQLQRGKSVGVPAGRLTATCGTDRALFRDR